MADNNNRTPNNAEDQTRPSGDGDKQHIAPPDANMGGTQSQGYNQNASGHEYGGSAADTRVSDSRSNSSHQRDYGSEAGTMGSAYDTELAQVGTPGSGALADTSADMAGLNSSDGGATYSGEPMNNNVGGMLGESTHNSGPGAAMHGGAAGAGAQGGQLGDTMGKGSVQEGTVGGAMASGALGTSPTGGDLTGNQSVYRDSTGGTPALGDPTRQADADSQ